MIAIRMNKYNTIIPRETLRRITPSIFTEEKLPTLSERYLHSDSTKMLDLFEALDWHPVMARQQSARKKELTAYRKHMIAFQHPDYEEDGTLVRMLFTNSHDGKNAFKIMAGLFRLVCQNGLIVSETELPSIRFLHNFEFDVARESLKSYIEKTTQLFGNIKEYKTIELTQTEQDIFAYDCMVKKFGEEENFPFLPDSLLMSRREEDTEPTLLNVFNRVQENIMKGGLRGKIRNEKGRLRPVTTRKIKAINATLEWNTYLWEKMRVFAQR